MPSKPKKKSAVASTHSGSIQHKRTPEPPKEPSIDPSSIHRERAKRWETTPYVAEWLVNAVAYCKTAKGQAEFREWLRHRYFNVDDYYSSLDACNKPPNISQKYRHQSTVGHLKQWGLASYELGVSPAALKLYHVFTSNYDIGAPERLKAPIKRRRGESAAMWNARVYDSLLDGSKMAEIDWEELRRIALSEADRMRDTLLVWHTDAPTVLFGVWARSRSTIMTPDERRHAEILGPDAVVAQLLNGAWRSRLHLAHIAHAHWSRAAILFEELSRRGLTTSSAIERAYKADAGLKWRLLSMMYWSDASASRYWSLVCQVVVSQDAFKPYVKAFRDDNGNLHMSPEERMCLDEESIESKVQTLFTDVGSPIPAYDVLEDHFAKRPEDKKKFGSFAWHLLGDVAVAVKFNRVLRNSAFGRALLKTADVVVNLTGADLDLFHQEFHFVDRPHVSGALEGYYGMPMITSSPGARLCELMTTHIVDLWLHAVFNPELPIYSLMRYLFAFVSVRRIHSTEPDGSINEAELRASLADPEAVSTLNESWKAQDAFLWKWALTLGPSNRVARAFGLFDPENRDWREAVVDSVDVFGSEPISRIPQSTPAPVPLPPEEYVQTIPVSAPTESLARSGHAVAREAEQAAPKAREKTKGDPGAEASLEGATPGAEDQDESGPEYPDVLPPTFKLGKKNLAVFRQLLGHKDQTAAGEVQPKLGVVRWEQFEKAMKRIGFEVVQTAGSSVRFDPPAKTARPITFHRPHPDAVLSPFLLKWIGSRLKRCYGWTASTFEYDPALTDAT